MYFDSHSHTDFLNKNSDIYQKNMEFISGKNNFVTLVGTEIDSKEKMLPNKKQYPENILLSIGLYPEYSLHKYEDLLSKLESQIDKDISAIGEIGLDYHWDYGTPDQQIDLMMRQISIANRYELPVIFHCRNAYDDLYKAVKDISFKKGAVIHCFSGNEKDVKRFIELDFFISFAGNITYKNAKNIQNASLLVPENRILVETDAPYLSPQKQRGKTNYPGNVSYNIEKIAKLRNTSFEYIQKLVYNNAKIFFNVQ